MRPISRKPLTVTVLALTVIAIAGVTPTSHATSLGKNGRIAYAAEVNGHYQIFTVAPDGTDVKQLTNFTDGSDAVSPDWSADGTLIAFEHDFPYPHAGLYTMNADGTDVQPVTPNRANLFEGKPALSPDAKSVATVQEVHHDENALTPDDYTVIAIRRLDGASVREVSPRVKITGSGMPILDNAEYSPDGKWITFVRINKLEVLQALYRVHPDGTGLRRLIPYTSDVALKHDWSPDGKLIALTTNADLPLSNQAANLVVIRPDGTGLKQITHFKPGKGAFIGSFSPDGKLLVFRYEEAGQYALAVIGRDGTNMKLLTKLSPTKPRFIDWGSHP